MNKLSGIIVNGNTTVTDALPPNVTYAQEFTVPSGYARAGTDVPNLTGFQVLVRKVEAEPEIDWVLEKTVGGVWEQQESGTSVGIPSDERGWMDIEFDAPTTTFDRWRILLSSNAEIYYSTTVEGGILTDSDGVPVALSNSSTVSSIHRVLGAVADSGIDLLGNSYRSALVERPASYVAMTSKEIQSKSWLSKPNPSKFAVECLYFDMRDGDLSPSVVNNILIDTITPGVYFNIYYSNDDNPGTDGDSWDELLWKRVPKTFQLDKRKTFVLPDPVTAKYIKLEFTHLQARPYSPGDHQQKVTYRKHPKWVLDYFYSLFLGYKASNEILSDTITLTYDAFDLYYDYFAEDILESPNYPQLAQQSIDTNIYNDFLRVTTEAELDQLDTATVRQIQIRMDTFEKHPLLSGALGSSLRTYSYPTDPISAYSTEVVTEQVANTDLISTEDRESVILDREFPVMNFYLPCRHYYKKSRSIFEHDRAYFVGINQIVFERDFYSTDYDRDIYIETAGDEVNIESNDLVSENGVWIAP